MEITWLGVLLFPVGAICFLVAPKWLYGIAVFSIPFTATSLLNSSSGYPLSPLLFFGTLLMVRQLLSSRRAGRALKVSRQDRSQLLLILFLGVVVLSMIMPVIINGRLLVSSSQLYDLYEEPLRLTVHNVKNPIPVIFGVLFSIYLIRQNDTVVKIHSTIKLYVISGLLVSLWGYFQVFCGILNIDYPYYLFNNAKIESMQGYTQQVEIGGDLYQRISSVTHEPSIFSKYLLTVLPIVFLSVLLRRPLFSLVRDRYFLGILTGVLVLATSSTGYLGITCVLFVTAILLRRLHLIGWRSVRYAGFVAIVLLTLYFKLPVFQDFVDALLFMKYESGSGLQRALSVVNSWEYFKQYPILGVGWAR